MEVGAESCQSPLSTTEFVPNTPKGVTKCSKCGRRKYSSARYAVSTFLSPTSDQSMGPPTGGDTTHRVDPTVNYTDSLASSMQSGYDKRVILGSSVIENVGTLGNDGDEASMEAMPSTPRSFLSDDHEFVEHRSEKRHRIDCVHALLSGRDVEEISMHSAISTPARFPESERYDSAVSTPVRPRYVHCCGTCDFTYRSSGALPERRHRAYSDMQVCNITQRNQLLEPFVSVEEDLGYNSDPSSALEDVVSRYYASDGLSVDTSTRCFSTPSVSPRTKVPSSANIKVVIRCRPVEENVIVAIKVNNGIVELHKSGNNTSILFSQRPRVKQYCFDSVLDGHSSQSDTFEATTRPLLHRLFEGVNGTIFAYGCTSAGKTYTMLGNVHTEGIVQMSVRYLIAYRDKYYPDCEIKFSFLEVYNESIIDLLGSGTRNLDIQELNNEIYVPFLRSVKVANREEALKWLNKGIKYRKSAMTAANRQSSRSHAVMQFLVNLAGKETKLSFIDLAGSERLCGKDRKPERLKESSCINQSLLALSNCISALYEGNHSKSRIKYRDSKLTLLLKNSLFNNSAVVMITAIHPGIQFLQESSNSLRYAQRAKDIKVTLESQISSCSVSEYVKALNEAYSAMTLIGELLPESVQCSIRKRLESSQLSGTPHFLNLLNIH